MRVSDESSPRHYPWSRVASQASFPFIQGHLVGRTCLPSKPSVYVVHLSCQWDWITAIVHSVQASGTDSQRLKAR